MTNEHSRGSRGIPLTEAINFVNRVLSTLDLGVWVRGATVYKEEVVIAYPQVEDYDRELSPVTTSDDIESGARYLAELKVISHGREVVIYVRFYLTSGGEFREEESISDSVVSEEGEEVGKPGLWQSCMEEANRWGPTIVNFMTMWLMRGGQ